MRPLIVLLCLALSGCYYAPYPYYPYYAYGYPAYRYPVYAPVYAPAYPPTTYTPAPYPYAAPVYAPSASSPALDPNNCGTPDTPKPCGRAARSARSYPAPASY